MNGHAVRKNDHGCALRLLEANLAIHPEPRGQHSRYPDEFLGETDASHPTALVPAEVARGPPIPDPISGRWLGWRRTAPQAHRGECRAVKAEPRRVAGIFDGVIDFNAVISDPETGELKPELPA